MFLNNQKKFGHLTNLDGFDITRTNPNIYELFNNKFDWEQAYLHSEYHEYLNSEKVAMQVFKDKNLIIMYLLLLRHYYIYSFVDFSLVQMYIGFL